MGKGNFQGISPPLKSYGVPTSLNCVISTGKICLSKFCSGEILPFCCKITPQKQDFSTALVSRFGRNDTLAKMWVHGSFKKGDFCPFSSIIKTVRTIVLRHKEKVLL